MRYYEWLKKIGPLHFARINDSNTLCGTPMLGNNYAKYSYERVVCIHCDRIRSKEDDKYRSCYNPD